MTLHLHAKYTFLKCARRVLSKRTIYIVKLSVKEASGIIRANFKSLSWNVAGEKFNDNVDESLRAKLFI